MSSPLEPEQRYPKRQRATITYYDPADYQDNLGKNSNTIGVLTDNSAANNDKATRSHSDEDWKPKSKKRRKKSKTRKPKPFPFMELPPELREKIYKLVVGSHDGFTTIAPSRLTEGRLRRTLMETEHRLDPFGNRGRFQNLSFLRVSKVIYREAAVVMYTKQKFIFISLAALQTFLLLLRPETLDRVVHIEVKVGRGEWQFMPGVSSQMLQLHYLQTLQVSMSRGCNDPDRSGSLHKHLRSTGRAMSTWEVSEESLDKLIGINAARNMYPSMFPFIHGVIRAGLTEVQDAQDAGSVSAQKSEKASNNMNRQSMTQRFEAQPNEEKKSLYKPLVGVDALVQALDVDRSFGEFFSRDYRSFESIGKAFAQFRLNSMTRDRRLTRRAAMKEELLTLMAKDSF